MEVTYEKKKVVVEYENEEWNEHVEMLGAIRDYIDSVVGIVDEEDDYDEMDEEEDSDEDE